MQTGLPLTSSEPPWALPSPIVLFLAHLALLLKAFLNQAPHLSTEHRNEQQD